MTRDWRDQAAAEDRRRTKKAIRMAASPKEPNGFVLRRKADILDVMRKVWEQVQALMIGGLILALAPMASLYAQTVPRHYAATSNCAHNLAVTEPIYGFSAADSIEIAAHEAVHRRQLAPGCDSVMALWGRDLPAKMEAEAEALCITSAVRHARSVQAAQWWAQFRGGESFGEYLDRFDRWCQ